ncbi:MAG: tatA [Firmicutes bacterium]|nr:tatA [Bacillota bacterium]
MHGIGIPEIILVLIIALVFFGPGKLPEVGKAVGNSINEFKKAISGDSKNSELAKTEEIKDESKKTEIK